MQTIAETKTIEDMTIDQAHELLSSYSSSNKPQTVEKPYLLTGGEGGFNITEMKKYQKTLDATYKVNTGDTLVATTGLRKAVSSLIDDQDTEALQTIVNKLPKWVSYIRETIQGINEYKEAQANLQHNLEKARFVIDVESMVERQVEAKAKRVLEINAHKEAINILLNKAISEVEQEILKAKLLAFDSELEAM
ncbi:hypothetical protein [uncultured Endozoicomonas sp.]|uniref:hypothetical protein n=1 Tax=uncultured Endozoicomonas sp. TaxID=432652 RepID=UPI00263736AA|nr:hypothetical protein [uncultured Endozoicomonas sp.]